jgi:hypothetical protein
MNAANESEVLEGHLRDSYGRLVPIALVKPIDLARHELTTEIIARAKVLHELIKDFKAWSMSEISSFIELSALEYGVTIGGDKGNVTLTTFDGRFQVKRAMQESVAFDERLQVAMALCYECGQEWTEGAKGQGNLRAALDHAFKADAEGRISAGRVLALRRWNIKDEKWHKAMEIISDSLLVVGSKSYLRVYERVGITDRFVAIPLDVAAS